MWARSLDAPGNLNTRNIWNLQPWNVEKLRSSKLQGWTCWNFETSKVGNVEKFEFGALSLTILLHANMFIFSTFNISTISTFSTFFHFQHFNSSNFQLFNISTSLIGYESGCSTWQTFEKLRSWKFESCNVDNVEHVEKLKVDKVEKLTCWMLAMLKSWKLKILTRSDAVRLRSWIHIL